MKDFLWIPKGRGKKDKQMWQFYDWWLRKNRKWIREEANKRLMDWLLWGRR